MNYLTSAPSLPSCASISVSLQTSKSPLKPERMATLFELTKDSGVLFGKGGLYGNVSHPHHFALPPLSAHAHTHTISCVHMYTLLPPDPSHQASLVCDGGGCKVCTACTEDLTAAVLIVGRNGNGNGNGDLGGGRAFRLTQAEPVVVLQLYVLYHLVLLECNSL